MSFGKKNSGMPAVVKQASEAANAAPAAAAPVTPNQEDLRKQGRSSLLISTTAQGVLGKPKTGRRQLLSAE
jgi:hypothetical protein